VTPQARQRLLRRTCCHCGLCAAVCPTAAIAPPAPGASPFWPRIEPDLCTDCGLCEQVCPTLHQPNTAAVRDGGPGPLRQALLAHARDEQLRAQAASGGAVTALALGWLAAGEGNQALVLQPERGDQGNLLPRPRLTSDPQIVRDAVGSHYAAVPNLHLLRQVPREELSRVLVVGLPCQLRALRQWGEAAGVTLGPLVGLFCAGAKDERLVPWLLRSMRAPAGRVRYFNARCGPFPGASVVELDDGSRRELAKFSPASEYMWRNALFAYRACLFCPDPSAEEADVAIGDPWLLEDEPGVGLNLLFVRTVKGQQLVDKTVAGGHLTVVRAVEDEELRPRHEQHAARALRAQTLRAQLVGDVPGGKLPLRRRLRPLVLYLRWRLSSTAPIAYLTSALPSGLLAVLRKLRI